jgi:hypothetical protein
MDALAKRLRNRLPLGSCSCRVRKLLLSKVDWGMGGLPENEMSKMCRHLSWSVLLGADGIYDDDHNQNSQTF